MKTSGRDVRRRLQVERLETRRLLASVVMSDWEQLLIELVNRARMDPAAEAARYGINLNDGLSPDTISASPKQPLAPNQALTNAAGNHSQDMLDRDFFSHTNPDGESPWDRMEAAGYIHTSAGENIAWTGTTGILDRDAAIFDQHSGLFKSSGHRVNILKSNFQEIGAGVRHGVFTTNDDYNASVVTEKFGRRAGSAFVTGVVYEDVIVRDNFYTIGEGLGSVTVTAVDASTGTEFVTQSGTSGGYSLRVPAGTYTVTASGDALDGLITKMNIVVGAENQKVDFLARDATVVDPDPKTPQWQNPNVPADVDDDGTVTPFDALLIINYLNRHGAGPLPASVEAPYPYVDVGGNDSVAPLDALLVINELNKLARASEGEFNTARLITHEETFGSTDSDDDGRDVVDRSTGLPEFRGFTDFAVLDEWEKTLSDIAEDVWHVWKR